MNKDDLFTSPTLKNKQYMSFYGERNPQSELEIQNLFTPLDIRHPFSPFSIALQNGAITPGKKFYGFDEGLLPMIDETPEKERKYMPTYIVNKELNFESQGQEQPYESECTPQKIISPSGSKASTQALNTTAKKYDLRFTGSATSRKTIREGQRGLRVLSKLAYQIVLQHGPRTYKQVADRLIEEQQDDERMDDKERQNIKRRVYDALNVLIALGELEKKGRKIVKSKKREKKQEQELKMIEAKNKTILKLKKKTQSLRRKKCQKQRISKIHKSLRYVMNRNKKMVPENSTQNKLFFPLIFNSFQSQSCIMDNQKVQFTCGKDEMLMGDTNAISFLPTNNHK